MKKLLILFVFLSIVVVGCQNKTNQPDSHQHEPVSVDQTPEGENAGHKHESETANHTDEEEEGLASKKGDPGHVHDDLKVSQERQKEWGIT